MIRKLTPEAPIWNKREIMRYARISTGDHSFDDLIEACILESASQLSYRVCYTVLPVSEQDGLLHIGSLTSGSGTLHKALCGCESALLFAATVGAPFDRLIQRYGRLSPSKAVILQAIGAERVESLCDAFCGMMNVELNAEEKSLLPRVSPGYGDIPLAMQRDLFAVLDCPRKIGLTLDESLMMSPSKSVTAIAGIVSGKQAVRHDKCAHCDKADCCFRTGQADGR